MKNHVLPLTLIGLTVIAWIIAYPNLPEQMPVHWNASGEVDDYAAKLYAMLSNVGIMALLYVSMVYLPKIDPRKKNYKYFGKSYSIILNVMMSVFFVISLLVILNGAGYDVPIASIGPLVAGIMFMVLGNYMPHVRSNFFLGIRTPWTLSNDEVWKRTHRMTARVFFFGGFLIMLTTFIPADWKQWIFILIITVTLTAPYLYSYLLYRKIQS